MDSARQNLAATFVNAFVNAGFGQDKLVTGGSHDMLLDGAVRKQGCIHSGSRRPCGPSLLAALQGAAVPRPPSVISSARICDAHLHAPPTKVAVSAATLDADSHSTDRVHWIFKNKDQGKTAATASLGLVTLWDVEGGLPQIDKFLYSKDNYVVAGW